MAFITQKQEDRLNPLGRADRGKLDLRVGAQQGYMPLLAAVEGDEVFDAWASNAAYTQGDVVPIVLRTPALFDLFPTNIAKKLRQIWVELYTNQVYSISGLDTTLTVSTDKHKVGPEYLQQAEVTNVERAQSTITIEWQELKGLTIHDILNFIIRYGMMDPDTKYALIGTIPDIRAKLKGHIYPATMHTGAMGFAELDEPGVNVLKGFIAVNFFPLKDGEQTGKLNKGAKELKRYSIEHECMVIENAATAAYLQTIIDQMSIFLSTPDEAILPANLNEVQSAQQLDGMGWNRGDVPIQKNGNEVNPDEIYKGRVESK